MAAFGIGTNSGKADAGVVRGAQKEITCECWFTAKGKVIPLMIKVEDEDGEIRAIKQISIHRQEAKRYAGIPSIEFDCTLTILVQAIKAKLIYYQTENRWVINFE